MINKILRAASWLGLVQVMNTLSVVLLSIVVIRKTNTSDVSSYMYALFLTDAVLSYTLLQIAQRITLAKDDFSFKRLFSYSQRFGGYNAGCAVMAIVVVLLLPTGGARDEKTVFMVSCLMVAGLANYFAQIFFTICDYRLDYKSFGLSSAFSNITSLVVAIGAFALGAGIYSMIIRELARGFILLALGVRVSKRLNVAKHEEVAFDRRSKLDFFGFLAKRHALKVIEVSNHRVPALVLSSGSLSSLGNFGVSFQLISQMMNVLTILSDKVAYAFFSRGHQKGKILYLSAVILMNAVAGLVIFWMGEKIFLMIYGPQWMESAKTFSYLGIYLFTHTCLMVITNYLITDRRFFGVYVSWGAWTVTFVVCYLVNSNLPIARYYVFSSCVAMGLIVATLLLIIFRSRGKRMSRRSSVSARRSLDTTH